MTSYRPAPAVERIAKDLIADHHVDLDGVRIEYVFRDKHTKSNGKPVMGKARKISGLNAYLGRGYKDVTLTTDGFSTRAGDIVDAEDFFVIEIAEDIWATLDQGQRVALVDHELTHCATTYDEDADEVKLTIRPHDLEEFRSVVDRHGLWHPDLSRFAEVIPFQQLRIDDVDDDPEVA